MASSDPVVFEEGPVASGDPDVSTPAGPADSMSAQEGSADQRLDGPVRHAGAGVGTDVGPSLQVLPGLPAMPGFQDCLPELLAARATLDQAIAALRGTAAAGPAPDALANALGYARRRGRISYWNVQRGGWGFITPGIDRSHGVYFKTWNFIPSVEVDGPATGLEVTYLPVYFTPLHSWRAEDVRVADPPVLDVALDFVMVEEGEL